MIPPGYRLPPDREHYDRIGEAMLAAVKRIGFDESADPRVQPAMRDAAQVWLEHWVELLHKDPLSALGPLASLLADAYQVGEREGRR
jgi:hypothetical protein